MPSAAGPKMAALIAAAAEPVPDVPFVSLTSEGVILIYGRDERRSRPRNLLKDHLDVTVLIKPPADVRAAAGDRFPRGEGRDPFGQGLSRRVRIDGRRLCRSRRPSSRGALSFRTGARRRGVALRPRARPLRRRAAVHRVADLRDGYLRADPGDPAAVLKAVLKARDLVGSFDKPRYVAFTEDLCAHSRSQIVGCTRCLDLCPTGAITPAGDHVAIDAYICAGCGQCAAVCPTGAAGLCAAAGGCADAQAARAAHRLSRCRRQRRPIVLLHDEAHGAPLIDALARFGDGLPANVLPIAVNEVTQVGLEAIAAAFAYGAAAVRLLLRAKPRHDIAGLDADARACRADPRRARLRHGRAPRPSRPTIPMRSAERCARSAATDRRRVPRASCRSGRSATCMRLALRELQRAAPAPVDVVALPAGRAVRRGRDQCRGLHALPRLRGGLPDRRARRRSRAADAALCRGRLRAMRAVQGDLPGEGDHAAAAARFPRRHRESRVLKEEEPFHCIRCSKPFGVKSTIERVVAKLEGKHWMFQNSAAAPRRDQDVRGLPGGGDHGAAVRSLRCAAAPEGAHHRGLSARARRAGARQQARDVSGAGMT